MPEGKNLAVMLEFLERVLTRFLLAFGIGYKIGADGKQALQAENEKLKLDAKENQNAKDVENKYRNRSDADVVNDILRRGKGE